MLEDARYPMVGEAFIQDTLPLTIGKIFRLDETAGRGNQRQFVVVDQQNGRWLIEEVPEWKAGPRFIAIRRLEQPPA